MSSVVDQVKIALEVLAVAFVIYKMLVLARGTRTLELFVLLVGILALELLSRERYLDLPTFRWILDRFWIVILLIVVILYQDDIRRSIGRSKWLDFLVKGRAITPSRTLEELIKAARALSAKRIGALIAIEREGTLEPYMAESGIRIEAQVSKELLFALFLPAYENPTHDGAVIVGKDRILSAGCILPLSNRTDLESWVGTRHRAAIGLSERVDAVAVVVSEETGRISVAIGGELKAGLSPDELRQFLTSELGQPAEQSLLERFRAAAGGSRDKG